MKTDCKAVIIVLIVALTFDTLARHGVFRAAFTAQARRGGCSRLV
jgi:hypothetical protein